MRRLPKNGAALAVAEALADFNVKKKNKCIESSSSEEADNEASDEEDNSHRERLRSIKKADATRVQPHPQQEEEPFPWWAQERKVDQLEHWIDPELSNVVITELRENLQYYSNVGQRSNGLLLLSILTVMHSLWWYQYLPNQIQICVRESETQQWWCEVDQGAERFILEYAKGQGLAAQDAFPVSNKMYLVGKTIVVVLGMNAVIVGLMQTLPFVLKKSALAPPEWIALQTKHEHVVDANANMLDTRRIALMSTFGYWLGCVGIAVNAFLIAVNGTTYQRIHFTHVESQKEEVYDNVGLGTDLWVLMHHYIVFVSIFFVCTGVMLYRFRRIHGYHQDRSYTCMKEIEDQKKKKYM